MTVPIHTLHVFPDTNVLVQCHAIDDLDWSQLGSFEIYVLIITKPVIEEIDRQKNGRGRLAKRARLANGWLRELLSKDEIERLTKKGQRVLIRADDALKPLDSLSSELDFGSADDRLVGIVARYCKENSDQSAILLSHDTGPLITAKRLNIPRVLVPDAWLLVEESDEDQKRIQELQNEVKRYQHVWPQCTISYDGEKVLERLKHRPLSDEEIGGLMHLLRDRFPVATDFTSKPPRQIGSVLLAKPTYEPADDGEIKEYQEKRYPEWLQKCEEFFRELHKKLNDREDRLSVLFGLNNTGGQPATDVLVRFEVLGAKFGLAVAKDEEDADSEEYFGLLQPPTPPTGRWVHPMDSMRSALEMFRQSHLGGVVGHASYPALDFPLMTRQDRDANKFYWKGGRPNYPKYVIELTCAQWRHHEDVEEFYFELEPGESDEPIDGVIEVQVHAANLIQPEIKRFPVRIETVERTCWEEAVGLLDIQRRGLRRPATS